MYAARHAVFIGPGKLPDELRHVLVKRAQAPQPDIAIQVPRLLTTFDNAADAERIGSQVQRLKLGAVVAGPEQPPAELSWSLAKQCVFAFDTWRVTTTLEEQFNLNLPDVVAITVLDWRPDEGAADRAVLLTLREGKPVLLRASTLDTVSRHSLPIDGIRVLNEVLDAAANVLTPETRVRTRKLSEADFRGRSGELTGDLLPLVLAVVDAVDSLPGELPRPLQGKANAPPKLVAHHTDLTALAAWILYVASLAGLVLSLAFFTVSALTLGLTAGLIGLALGAWGTRRFMWSRWLARANWGERPPIPPWPIDEREAGIHPKPLELGIDAFTLMAVSAGVIIGEGLFRSLSLWTLPFVLFGVLTSTVAVYEAWQRE